MQKDCLINNRNESYPSQSNVLNKHTLTGAKNIFIEKKLITKYVSNKQNRKKIT